LRILDKKFRSNIHRYLFQCSLATLIIFITLLFLNVLEETAIIASLGATTFIIFTMPTAYSSRTRPLVGGYLVGVAVGMACYYIMTSQLFNSIFISNNISVAVFGAIAVGLAIFIMVAIDAEHAPAAGIALVLILNEWQFKTIIFILATVIIMALLKKILKPILIDLI
jgi:CBS-domain-containing membrane protein